MASVEVAIRAIFSGAPELKKGAEAVNNLAQNLQNLSGIAAQAKGADVGIDIARQLSSQIGDVAFPNLEEQIRAAREYAAAYREAAVAAAEAGNNKLANTLNQQAEGYQRAAQAARAHQVAVNNAGKSTQFADRTFNDFLQRFRNTGTITQATQAVTDYADQIRNAQRVASSKGDLVEVMNLGEARRGAIAFAEALIREARAAGVSEVQLTRLRDRLREIDNAHRKTTQSAGLFLQTFNRIGFTLFIIRSSINTVTGLIRDLWSTMREGADITSQMISFNRALESVGESGAAMRESLAGASRGLIDMNTMQEQTLRLLKAGIPDFENTSVRMARLAANASRVSGALGTADEVYQKLIKGIVRGSPRLIDDADVVLKLGNAYEQYAESVGKSADELSEREQQLAVLQALEQEEERMQRLADAVGALPSEPMQVLEVRTKAFGREVKGVIGAVGTQLAGALLSIGGYDFNETEQSLEEIEAAAEAARMEVELLQDAIAQGLGTGTEEGAEQAIRSMNDFIDSLSRSQQIAIGLRETIAMVGITLGTVRDALVQVGNMLLVFVYPAAGILRAVFERIENNIALAGKQLELFWAQLTRNTSEAERLSDEVERLKSIDPFAAMKEGGDKANQALAHIIEQMEDIRGMSDLFGADQMAEIRQQVLIDMGLITDGVENTAESMFVLPQATKQALNSTIAQLQEFLGAQGKFERASAKVWESYWDKIAEINEDELEKLTKTIPEEFSKKWRAAQKKYDKKRLRAEEDYWDDREKIINDFQDDEADEIEKHNEKVEDLEEDHQKKLRDIERKFFLSAASAIIDRDARALFEAELKRREDLRKAEEDFRDRMQDEQDRHQDELDQIRENEEEKLAEFDAAHKKKMRRMEEDFEEEKKAIVDWQKEQARLAREAADEQRAEAKEAAQERIEDLEQARDEQLAIEAAKNALAAAERARDAENLDEYLTHSKTLWNEYNTFLQNLRLAYPSVMIPGGGGIDITGDFDENPFSTSGIGADTDFEPNPSDYPFSGGGSGCTPTISFTPTQGQRCGPASYGHEKLKIAPDCSSWWCTPSAHGAYSWMPYGQRIGDRQSVGMQSTQTTGTTSTGGPVPVTGTTSTGQQTVMIQTNDPMLKEILSSISYEAYMEIMT